ncbi:LOW QUALITY PROTEIN: hypothetical protein QC764_0099570 [Podospora pseudoanserina]|uniref:Uncharacterized protein n=1 Tax=Podospora pseudoanserina TaxID=2609844 RepID=A0ABR0HVB2_9PEZI|nr:LOW QUALITY PROTEIN: hypothetical protein QC764_0099570 [Podospora pseudoanserina]
MVGVARLVELGAARGDDVGRVELAVHGVCLAGVDHEQDLVVPSLLPHLLKRIGQIPGANLLRVLELEELVAPVAGHDVGAVVGEETFGPGHLLAYAVGEEADEVLDCDLVAADSPVGGVFGEGGAGQEEGGEEEGGELHLGGVGDVGG